MSLSSIPCLATLSDTAILTVGGRDASTFLHAQLSCDLLALPAKSFTLGAWHSPSGKVKALFRLLRVENGWLLTTTRESAARTVADLSRFVLRDDVTLRDDSRHRSVCALIGDSSQWLADGGVELSPEPGRTAAGGGLEWLRIGPELIHVIGPNETLKALTAGLPECPEDEATAAEISLGIPSLPVEFAERFVPQMLNLDLLGALDTGKGCYPGQEIIARTQNLGSVKRRIQRFSSKSATPPDTGSPVIDDSGQIVGEVLRAAASENAVELLALVRLAGLESPLFLESEPGSPLRRESLPYDDRLSRSLRASDEETE